jgi:hypothetical protein
MVTGLDKGEGLIIRFPTSVADARGARFPGLEASCFDVLSSEFAECEEEEEEVAAAADTVGAGALRLADCLELSLLAMPPFCRNLTDWGNFGRGCNFAKNSMAVLVSGRV